MEKLTQETLKQILSYSPTTGIFTWKINTKGWCRKGSVTGRIGPNGYRRIKLRGKSYYCHRLAWLYMEGYFPKNYEIDHINQKRADNRWHNLRIVSHSCNTINSGLRNNNASGITGVCWDKRREKWLAHITINGKTLNVGRFKFKINAVKARAKAEKTHNFPTCKVLSPAFLFLQGER